MMIHPAAPAAGLPSFRGLAGPRLLMDYTMSPQDDVNRMSKVASRWKPVQPNFTLDSDRIRGGGQNGHKPLENKGKR